MIEISILIKETPGELTSSFHQENMASCGPGSGPHQTLALLVPRWQTSQTPKLQGAHFCCL